MERAGTAHSSRRAAAVRNASVSTMVPINGRAGSNAGPAAPAASSSGGGGRRSAVKPPRRPPAPSSLVADANNGAVNVLQHQATIDADEAYGEQEKALSEFLKLHPMLSLCVRIIESAPRSRAQ
jgi:hypothetical protein